MKQWFNATKLEKITFLIGMPIMSFVISYLLVGNRAFHDSSVWIYSIPLIYFIGLISWHLHIGAMNALRLVFPHLRQTTTRITILTVTHLSIVAITYLSIFYLYAFFHFFGYQLDRTGMFTAMFIGFGGTMISTSMWEADYSLKKWKESLMEKERLEQLTIQQEFETLKSQVNPHFLFNCFNTLSSLISEDRKQAEVFLDELSKVYRYLLRNNEDGLSSLQTEIKFIESYYQLLQTRHGAAVQLTIEIDKKYDQYLLPSLTLQLLVENAVKHNVLSRNKPLMIDIFTTAGNKLVVSNNLQARTVKGPSNKIGLENIKTKYELLNHSGFQVLQDRKSFSVVLPLIWNRVNEQQFIIMES